MNRIEFMKQLESLLQNISPTEREEALQYYNDYFNDAGVENEQGVIEALGNPAKVAETIKRDLYGAGYEESVFQKPISSDRAVVEYDASGEEKKSETGPANDGISRESAYGTGQENSGGGTGAYANNPKGGPNGAGAYGGNHQGGQNGTGTYGNNQGYTQSGFYGKNGNSGYTGGNSSYGTGYGAGAQVQRQKKMSTGMVVLIVVLCVLASPVIISVAAGVVSLVVGLAAGWLGLVLGFGIAAIVLFVLMLCLIAAGIAGMFISPAGAMGLIGGGLVCGGIGLLFLMLTVAMVGIVTPAVIQWVAGLFTRRKAAA